MRASQVWSGAILLLLTPSCRGESSSAPGQEPPSPAPSVVSAAAPSTSAAQVTTASAGPMAAPPAQTASPDDDDAVCMTAALSMDRAKPQKAAEAPFQSCAAGVFSHCGGGNGERGHLCSIPLDVVKTKQARTKKPDSCCYGRD